MIGLLLKDVFILKKFYLSALPLMLLYGVFQFMVPETSMLSIVILLFGAMASQSTFSYDELAKWDHYILSSPISRKMIVKSKYVFSLINLLAAIAIATGINLIFLVGIAKNPVKEIMLINIACCSVGLLYLSLTMPLFLKFGQERARAFIIPIYMFPIAGFILLSNSGIFKQIPVLTEEAVMRIVLCAPVVCCLLLLLSYFISVSIYEKKEF